MSSLTRWCPSCLNRNIKVISDVSHLICSSYETHRSYPWYFAVKVELVSFNVEKFTARMSDEDHKYSSGCVPKLVFRGHFNM